jgi:glucose/arabinose dehydrogenase
MRRPVLLVAACAVVFAALAVGGLAALAGDDELEDLKPPKPAEEGGRAHHFDVRRTATGLNRPTWVGAAPGDDGALWVLEQPGRVLRIHAGERRTVLDLSNEVLTGAEQGLLGIAFHPDFARDRRVYLHWSDRKGDTRVAELRARGDGTIAPRPRRELLHVDQPEENHNGGQLAFGPDGRLYLGLGDGGGAFDPRRTAQDPDSKLGKLLATPVDAPQPEWKIVLTGLRNPWRFSFDVGMNEVWIGDVGQDAVEEVDRVPLELDERPKNLGWSAFEGIRRISGHELERGGDIVWPVATYDHDAGCSITGGPIYGGSQLAPLARRYVYGDFCSGALWTLRPAPGGKAEDVRREQAMVPQLTHIGVDDRGELVFASGGGALYRAVAPGS